MNIQVILLNPETIKIYNLQIKEFRCKAMHKINKILNLKF
jgi:hypothetical protein